MRKYNNKTKKTMIIILVLFALIIVIFSYALKKSIDIEKTVYKLTPGAILFDAEQNKITLNKEGIIKIKWGGDYYLIYEDKDYDLGSHAVVYNSSNGDTTLYGKFYEVTKDEKVEVIKGENKIKSSVNSKFYKLADRKYLIIDRTIESKDSSFVTSNYLIVNLDKLGNATLLNDKTSFKTITPTVLRTSAYTFDIANEKLNFGADTEEVDLKKIIGSTNEYDEETYDLNATNKENEEGEGNGTGTGSGDGTGSGSGGAGGAGGAGGGSGEGGDGTGGSGGTGGTGDGTGEGGSGSGVGGLGTGSGGGGGSGSGSGDGTGTGTGGGSGVNGDGTTSGNNSQYNNNYDGGVSDSAVDEIINATKNTSVIRVTSGINTISVDYVVYDPVNEYKSVYIEVLNTTTSTTDIVHLSKTDTNIEIRNLTPNVYYNLTFKYTYYDENKDLKEYTFDETGIFTKIPEMLISATKISNNKIYYKVSLDSNYTITGGTVNLYLNGQFTGISSSIAAKGSVSEIKGNDCFIDISSLNLTKKSEVLELRLVSLSFNTYTINPSINYKFKY